MDVLLFSTSRADSGPLQPVIDELAKTANLKSGVAHLRSSRVSVPAGMTDTYLDLDLPAETPDETVSSGCALTARLDAVLAATQPRLFLVLGDRWELLFAIPVAVIRGIPVMHLHGGELSEGAMDERVRHAVTKMSDFHCVATCDASARVQQLGEPSDRIWVTGAPGLDRLATTPPLTESEWFELVGAPAIRPVGLVTYHPATAGREDPGRTAENILEACAAKLGTVVVSHPGLDQRAGEIVCALDEAAARHPNVHVIPHLGVLYPRALAACDLLVGNSSSGIIEAASFHTPVVNVGVRQQGRQNGGNVIHCGTDLPSIRASIDQALSLAFREACTSETNPYGDGHAAPRIVTAIRKALETDWSKKQFVDQLGGDRAEQ